MISRHLPSKWLISVYVTQLSLLSHQFALTLVQSGRKIGQMAAGVEIFGSNEILVWIANTTHVVGFPSKLDHMKLRLR